MFSRKTWRQKAAAAAGAMLISLAGLVGSAEADVPESQDPIKIAINEWTGQHLSAHIAGKILQQMGYNVDFVTAGGLTQFTAIAQGAINVNPEIWTNSVSDIYPQAVATGDIVVLGELGLKPREGWIYPPYMEEKCPGLPSYQALYDCIQAFATAETFPNGRLITYPADWGTRSKDVVASIGLPFTAVAGGSEGAMIAELKSALAAEKPILMMFWKPHWLFAQHEFNWVEWNSVEGECVEETQTKDTACGFQQATVDKIISKNVLEKWPAAAAFLKRFTLTNEDQNRMIYEVVQNRRSLEEVVQEWIDQNEATWKSWTE